ncbi:hypothetical protein LTR53_016633, partial [Teratosphaeriaceae sp. CCFEE 6253]
MPRPPDTYAHSQFTIIETDNKGETVQCNHCKQWTGNTKMLARKREHLVKCPAYHSWRAEGHGEDLREPAPYAKRKSGLLGDDDYDETSFSEYAEAAPGPQLTPAMGRTRNYDVSMSFDEFYDSSATQKVSTMVDATDGLYGPYMYYYDGLNVEEAEVFISSLLRMADANLELTYVQCVRVRCRHCGFVRAKNTTRQVEHLTGCREFLNTPEGQQAMANGDLMPNPVVGNGAGKEIWLGGQPNPVVQGVVAKRGPYKPRQNTAASQTIAPRPQATRPQQPPKPSLAGHLVSRLNNALTEATQKPFLSHAGCGTLSATALNEWLSQEIHISRALVPFVGSLIGKIRIPETSDLIQDPTYRAIDLLCSAVNNMKKELEFLESTKRKYNLDVATEEPLFITQGFIDLLASACAPESSLLEGLVVLWATEHCFCASFQYAGTYRSTMPPSSNYQLPSYLNPSAPTSSNMYATSDRNIEAPHVLALREAFIQNWTSANFVRF